MTSIRQQRIDAVKGAMMHQMLFGCPVEIRGTEWECASAACPQQMRFDNDAATAAQRKGRA